MTNEEHIADETLFSLCEAYGVDRGYYNIWGEHRELSRSTAEALLLAFDVDVNDVDAVRRAQSEVTDRHWHQPLPTVIMIDATESRIATEIVIDAGHVNETIGYEFVAESGERHTGFVAPEERQEVERRAVDSTDRIRQSISVPLQSSPAYGFHRLTLAIGGKEIGGCSVVVGPRRCTPVPEAKNGPRHWGLTVQLYSLRSSRNWGIGDFSDLLQLIDIAADMGAAVVGVNPLHALNLHAPPTPNPYSPSSRHFLNLSYLDVESIADFVECDYKLSDDQRARLRVLREHQLIDHAVVIGLKFEVLRAVFDYFSENHIACSSSRAIEFEAFRQQRGEHLRLFAIFEAFAHANAGGTPGRDGSRPMPFAATDAAAIDAFVSAHGDLVRFFEYLQWQADLQLNRCVQRTRERGMAVGLYVDFAVGCTFGSADVWAQPALFADGVEIGAPADDFSPDGQSWGTAPLRPDALEKEAYGTFVRLLRDNMRYAGAMRIDHVLGLLRQFWVPVDRPPTEGAYVRYPLQALLALVALESVRNDCVVVGEDLGNVPDEIRHALWEWGVLSTRIFYFEKYWDGDHAFRIPEHYPGQALTTVGSHDLPTLRGFWDERDLDIFATLDRFPSTEFANDRYGQRKFDRERILDRMREDQVDTTEYSATGPLSEDAASRLAVWLYAWLARSPSQILLVQPEDVFGVLEQTNVPGTVSEHPNWRRKLPINLSDWRRHAALSELAKALRNERPTVSRSEVDCADND